MKIVQKIKIFLVSLGILVLILTQPFFLLIAESDISPLMEEMPEMYALFFEDDSSFEKIVEEPENGIDFWEDLLLEDSLQVLSEYAEWLEDSQNIPNTLISLDRMILVSMPQKLEKSGFKTFGTDERENPLDDFDFIDQIVNEDQTSYILYADPAESDAAFFARVEEAFPQAQIQPNYRYELYDYTPNDPSYSSLRAFPNTQWPKAIIALLEREEQHAPIVAVVDIGVDYNHPDLANQMRSSEECKKPDGTSWGSCENGASFFYSGWFLSGTVRYANASTIENKNPLPESMVKDPYHPESMENVWSGNDHGTHIAGTIGAEMNNGMGVVGVNPYAQIMAIKAGYTVGTGSFITSTHLVQGIDFARNNGAQIINASRGMEGTGDVVLTTAISNFTDAGGIFVAAAGNEWKNAVSSFPCNLSATNPRVICVGATNSGNNLASFSNHSTGFVSIAAPGVDIYSTTNGGSYKSKDWTSMATPMVVGWISLLATYRPDLTGDALIEALYTGAEQIPWLSATIQSGKKLNLYESFKALDIFAPTLSGWVDTSERCLSGSLVYHFTGYDDLWESEFPYSRDGGATWTDANSYLTGATGLSLQMRDRVGNFSYLLLDAFLPLCQPELKLSKSFSNTLTYTLDLETNVDVSCQITGDLESGLFTGMSNQSTGISIQLLSGDGEKNLYRTLSRGKDMFSGSGMVILDTLAPSLSLNSHQHLATTTDASITLIGTVSDEGGLASLTLNGGVLEPQGTTWTKAVNLAIGNNIFMLQASDFAGNSTTISFTIIRENVIKSPGWWGWWGWWGWNTPPPVKKVEEEKTEQVQTWVQLLSQTTETKDTTLSGLLSTFQQQQANTPQQLKMLNKALASIQGSDFSQELKDAYLYGYLRGITTMETISEANLEGPLTRAAMAKMMSVYATQVLWKKVQKTDQANFQDLDTVGGDLPGYIQLAYQLQIMGVDGEGNALATFSPDRTVTRAEFATVLSRVLYGNLYNQSGADFYSAHLGALQKSWILSNITPTMQEMRGWVMLMLMRTEIK